VKTTASWLIPALTAALHSAVAVSDYGAVGPVARVEVANPSDFVRNDQPLWFSLDALGLDATARQCPPLVAAVGDRPLPAQGLDMDRDGRCDTLLLVTDLAAGERLKLEVREDAAAAVAAAFPKRTQAEISRKFGGRWEDRKYIEGQFFNVHSLTPPEAHTDHSQFIRYEGPGIESDKVGYRVYLDERNGFDIFGKRIGAMVLQQVGLDGFDSYHEPADWGLDILKVGSSLGIGGYGYWNGESVERVSDVSGWTATVTDNGPLYSAFEIDYRDWKVAGKTIDLNSRLSMLAGSRLVHVELESSAPVENFVTGLVKHPDTELIKGDLDVTGKAWSYLATWGKQSLDGGNLGMAVLFRKGELAELAEDEVNQAVVLKPRGRTLDYYFLAAWDGESEGVQTLDDFREYLVRQAERLTIAPRVSLSSRYGQSQKQFPVTAETALDWARRLADAELARHGTQLAWGGWDEMRGRPANWEYTTGLLMQAYDALGDATGEQRYNRVAEEVISSYVTPAGEIHSYDMEKYNIDSINSGKMLLRLYEKTGEERYRKAADLLRQQLQNHPRVSEGAFWHKQRYPYQLWLDGVYMGMPFLAGYSQQFEDGHSLDEVVSEFEITRRHLRDEDTGLYWHAWDEKKQQVWADSETGRSDYFWGRGLGWLAMALVDTLPYIPEAMAEERETLQQMTTELAAALVSIQGDSGLWYQVLDRPEALGNYLEASASSMFVYMLARGVNDGILPGKYRDAAIRGYEGLVREFVEPHPDGSDSLTGVCEVAGLGFGRDGSYKYYMSEQVVPNDPKGLGPFILASIEVSELLKKG